MSNPTLSQTKRAPYNQFILSKLNVRKTGGMNIDELAASILSTGRVLQNVIAFKQTKKGKETGMLEIVAGGRRWRAVQALVKTKKLPADFKLNYLEVSEEEAVQMSLSENSGREPMHPADEFEAMHELVTRGKTIDDVAAAFGVLPIVVKRRLRLANIAPPLFQLYREDGINLQQLEALALTDDHAKQEQVWQALPNYNRHAQAIRDMLTCESVNSREDAVALYVGVAAYEKAGGIIVKDLFSEDDTGYMQDVPLLEKIAIDKLEQHRKKLLEEGAAWVDINLRANRGDIYTYGRPRFITREPTQAEQDIYQQLQRDQEQFDIDQQHFDVQDEGTDEEYELLNDRAAILEARWDDYQTMLESPAPEDAKITGAVLTLDKNGEVVIHRHLIRPEDKKRVSIRAKGELTESDGGATEKVRPAHSEKLIRNLTAHRTAALQAKLMERTDIALITLACRLVRGVFYHRGCDANSVIRIQCEHVPLSSNAPDIEQSKAWKAIDAKHDQFKALLPVKPEILFSWMLEQKQEIILELIAFCTALTINTMQPDETASSEFEQIGCAIDLTMSDWWIATQENYFRHVSKQRIVDVVTEAVSSHAAIPLAGMKKAAAAEAAERAVSNANWLPTLMKLKMTA